MEPGALSAFPAKSRANFWANSGSMENSTVANIFIKGLYVKNGATGISRFCVGAILMDLGTRTVE